MSVQEEHSLRYRNPSQLRAEDAPPPPIVFIEFEEEPMPTIPSCCSGTDTMGTDDERRQEDEELIKGKLHDDIIDGDDEECPLPRSFCSRSPSAGTDSATTTDTTNDPRDISTEEIVVFSTPETPGVTSSSGCVSWASTCGSGGAYDDNKEKGESSSCSSSSDVRQQRRKVSGSEDSEGGEDEEWSGLLNSPAKPTAPTRRNTQAARVNRGTLSISIPAPSVEVPQQPQPPVPVPAPVDPSSTSSNRESSAPLQLLQAKLAKRQDQLAKEVRMSQRYPFSTDVARQFFEERAARRRELFLLGQREMNERKAMREGQRSSSSDHYRQPRTTASSSSSPSPQSPMSKSLPVPIFELIEEHHRRQQHQQRNSVDNLNGPLYPSPPSSSSRLSPAITVSDGANQSCQRVPPQPRSNAERTASLSYRTASVLRRSSTTRNGSTTSSSRSASTSTSTTSFPFSNRSQSDVSLTMMQGTVTSSSRSPGSNGSSPTTTGGLSFSGGSVQLIRELSQRHLQAEHEVEEQNANELRELLGSTSTGTSSSDTTGSPQSFF